MPVVGKSVGPVAENQSGTALSITIPVLAVGDVVSVSFYYFGGSGGTPTVPAGWSETGTQHQDGSIYVRTYWRYASAAEAEHAETFTAPSGASGAIAAARVVSGAANAAPTVSSVNNTSAVAYWQTPQIDGPGFRTATAILYAARASSGAFTTAGTITSTNTSSFHVTALGAYRFAGASYDVTAATAGFVRATITGGSATSTVRMLQFAEAPAAGGGSLSGTTAVTVTVSGNPVNPNEPVPSYPFGPTGTHWPSLTPKPWQDTFTYDVEVAPTWTAIQNALDAAPASGNAIIRVQPGTLPLGAGAQSGDSFTLQGGPTTRANKILIIPRDGWGTVVGQGSIANKDSSGYKIGLFNTAMMGFDFTNQGVNFCDANYGAIGWSTFGWLQVTQRSLDGNDIELVECVLPNQEDMEEDRSAVRVAGGYSINDLTIAGSYFAPAYKANGSTAHCDTLQFSGTGGGGVLLATIKDSVFFQSSSQVIMAEVVSGFDFQQTAVIGGLRGTGRFPIASGRHVMVGENALWGGSLTATASNSVVMGSINSNYPWSGVTNSRTSTPAPLGWTEDTSFNGQDVLQTSWINTNTPNPTPSYLSTTWAQLEDSPGTGPVSYPLSGTTAVTVAATGNPTKTTRMSGTTAVTVASTGALALNQTLSGTTAVTVLTTGNPVVIPGVGNALSGTVSVVVASTGNPNKTTRMSGTVPVIVASTGNPRKTTNMSGTVAVIVLTTGDLRLPATVINLSGTINVVTNTTGDLRGKTFTNKQIWDLFEFFASQSGLKPRYLFTLQQHEEYYRRNNPSA